MTTHQLSTDAPTCSASGPCPRLSKVAGIGWIVHPAACDPATITAEDAERDASLRVLSDAEAGELWAYTLDVIELHHGKLVLRDPCGGMWWPSDVCTTDAELLHAYANDAGEWRC